MSPRILGLGEVLWDLLPTGPQLGGAPGNFACHARALGAEAGVITRVGADDLGREALRRLEAAGLPRELVQVDAAAPTGTVTVKLGGAGVPEFTIHEGVAWDRLEATEAARAAARRADAVCFGTLAQRSPAAGRAIRELAGLAPAKALRIFDINLRQHHHSREVIEASLQLANVLKLNDAELPVVAAMFALAGDERAQLAALAARFQLRVVAYTRGAEGSWLLAGERWSECRPAPVKVIDTVGAGDSFTAGLAVGLLRRLDLDAVHKAAGEIARYVCTQPGATPPLPAELRAPLAGGGAGG